MLDDRRYLFYYKDAINDLIIDINISINSDGKHLSKEALETLKDIKKDLKSYRSQINNIIEGKSRYSDIENNNGTESTK